VLALAGVAAAAVPGSPVRQWIQDAVLSPTPQQQPALVPEPAPPAAAPAPEAASSALRGISIPPRDGGVRVVLENARRGLRLRVRLTDGAQGEAMAVGDTPARFGIGHPGAVIRVMVPGPGEVRVALPRAARAAQVEVNGRVYAVKDGTLRARVPAAESTSDELVFLIH
jgi:hypothetical protein